MIIVHLIIITGNIKTILFGWFGESYIRSHICDFDLIVLVYEDKNLRPLQTLPSCAKYRYEKELKTGMHYLHCIYSVLASSGKVEHEKETAWPKIF